MSSKEAQGSNEQGDNLDFEEGVCSSEALETQEQNEPVNEAKDTEALELKIKELQDQYLRTHADFENVKKRLEKEKAQALEYANQNILKDILPVADTLEKALQSAKTLENGEKIAEGIELTLSNFHKILGKYGVELIGLDSGFDPNLHDAIMQVKNPEKEDGQIEQVLQQGYKYKERVLRPAMVSLVKN